MTIARSGTGRYAVTFPGLAAVNGGTVAVTGYATNGWCQVQSWSANIDVVANVLCFAPGGTPRDQTFDILYAVGAGTPAYAYAWDDDSSTSGAVSRAYSFDGKGGTITSQHTGTGQYSLRIPHLVNNNGTVKVTAYGTAPALCSVNTWVGSYVYIDCYNPSGAAMDSDFDVTFANGAVGLLGVPGHKSGYADDYLTSTSGPLMGAYQFDSAGGAVHVVHNGTGRYTLTFPHIGESGGDVQVSANVAIAVHCAAESWEASGTTAKVLVTCADALGDAEDIPFDVQYAV